MREVKIVFHVGKQKTATTFIQKNIKSTNNLLYVGKLINKSDKKKFIGKINEIHNRLFQKYSNYLGNSFANPTRNSFKLVSEYAEEIINLIKLNPNIKQIIISDECISDYYNHLGEHNLFLIIILGNLISKKLSSEINLRKVLSFTIRNQLDIIKSFYSYNLFINNNFDDYLKNIFKKKYSYFAGSLFYFEVYSMSRLITNNEWLIKLTPYEILSIDKKPLLFIKEAICLNEEMFNCIKKENINESVNVTKIKSNSNSYIKKQFRTPLYKYILKFSFKLKYNSQYKFYPLYYSYFIKNLCKTLIFIDSLFMKLFSKLLIKEYILSEESKNKIYKIYEDDNKLLKDLLFNYDLTRYGYY